MLVRSVLTRSDLGGAIIEGADFSDAVLDLPQKQVCLFEGVLHILKAEKKTRIIFYFFIKDA